MRDISKYKISVFGDSVPKGLYLDNQRIMRIEHNAVDVLADEYHCNIDNNSYFGQTLKRMCEKGFFDEYLKHLDGEKRYVVISLGGNDADYNWAEVAQAPYANHSPKTSLKEYADLLDRVVKTLQEKGVKVGLTSIPPIDAKRFFDNVISQKYDGGQVMKFLKNDLSNLTRHQESYNQEVLKCALRNKCTFFDYRTPLIMKNDFLDYLCEDGLHPNQLGHYFIANVIIDGLENKNDFFDNY